MTRMELAKILTTFGYAWPNRFQFPSGDEANDALFINTWHKFLGEYPKEVVSHAAQAIIAQNQYPPSVHDFLKKIHDLASAREQQKGRISDTLPAEEVWYRLLDHVGYYGRYRINEALEKLPPLVRKVTECVGFERICRADEFALNSLRKSFIAIHDQLSESEKGLNLLPSAIKERLVGGRAQSLESEQNYLLGGDKQ